MSSVTEDYLYRQKTEMLDGIFNFLLLGRRWKEEQEAISCILRILQEREVGVYRDNLHVPSSAK